MAIRRLAARIESILRTSVALRYAIALLAMGATIGLVFLFRSVATVPNAGVLYLLVVIASAYWLGTGPAIVALLLSLFAIAYLYRPLDVSPVVFGARFAVISAALIVGLLLARLARLRGQRLVAYAQQAREQAAELNAALTAQHQASAERERLLREVGLERERFQAVVEHAPAGIAVLRPPDFVFDLVNPACQAIAPDLVMLGRPVAEVWPDLAQEVVPLLEEVVRSGEPYEAVGAHFRARRAPGAALEDLYFSYTYEPMRGADGRVEAVLVLVQETTRQVLARAERERLLEKLREVNSGLVVATMQAKDHQEQAEYERARWQATIESAPAGVVTYDPSGKIVRMNPAATRIMGVSQDELELPMAELLVRLRFESDDGRPLPLDEFPPARALRGERVAGIAIAFHRGDRKAWIYDGAAPILAGDGTLLGAVASFVDVTEARELQERQQQLLSQLEARAGDLAFERDRLRTVVESIADAVFVCDDRGSITLVNDAGRALLGEAPNGLRGALADYMDAPELRYSRTEQPVPIEDLAIARALRGEIVTGREETAVYPRTGRRIDLLISAAPLRDASGRIVGAVEVARDVSERAELDRMKDQFIAVAAHELKTPLTIMKGYSQALVHLGEDRPERRRMLDAIDRGADRITEVVQDLLDVSQLQTGLMALEVGRVDLRELVSQVVDRLGAKAPSHRVRVVSADPVVVQGDRVRLEQVLENLLDNAIRYSPNGGDVDVSLSVRDGEAVVSVKDQGVGIPEDRQPRIFERFYRAHAGTPYDFGRLGVGLYIAREIISRHGGRMWFESREDVGSTFSFSLPLEPAQAQGQRPSSP